jgi:protein TonB
VTVRHELRTERPVPFHTQKPCAYLVRRELGRSRLDRGWTKRFIATLGLPRRADSLAICASPHCFPDSTGASKVTLTFGPRSDELTLDLEFDVVSASVRQAFDFSCFSLEGRADSLLGLLREAMPEDTVIRALKVCENAMPASQESSDRPPPGSPNGADELPETVRRTPPEYPEAARSHGVSGTVRVGALVGKDGVVKRTLIWASIPELDQAAVRAVENWGFKPARSRGKNIAVWVVVPVRFSLH